MATLLDILNDLLQNRGPKTKELKGGLFLQYKQPETPFGELAIVCYRIELERLEEAGLIFRSPLVSRAIQVTGGQWRYCPETAVMTQKDV